MDDNDFEKYIFRVLPPEEVAAQAKASAEKEQKLELYQSLGRHDFSEAADLLKKAGSCAWDRLLPHGQAVVSSSETFYSQLAIDKDSTTLTLNQSLYTGGHGLFSREMQFIPRLTIKDDICPRTK